VLIPREHGAYGQLAFPLATALALARPTPGAIALAIAGVAAFLSHESLLIVLGQRGGRAAREQRTEARRTLLLFGTIAVVGGVLAVVWLNPLARWALALPAVIALQLAIAVFSGKERTSAGEILAAATLSSLALPVAVGVGVTMRSAFTVFAVFALIFTMATTAVRAIIVRGGRGSEPLPRTVAGVLTLSVIGGLRWLGSAGYVQPIASWAALPVGALALYLVVRPPAPRQLRVVGWALVAATTATAIVLVVGLR
jgi:hypothetical protein